MKAIAVSPHRRTVDLIEREAPRIDTPTSVQLRVLDVGVCGTDREICAFAYGTPPDGSEHLVLGHESLAEVIDVGPDVSRVRRGDLVVPMVRRPCAHHHCDACRAGRQDFCFTGDFAERGIKGVHGFMTEVVVDDERYMHVVPRALRDVGVLVEPLTIAEKALHQAATIQARLPRAATTARRALVIGAGPVGLLGAMALVARGYDTSVYSREPASDPKAGLVAAIGARYLPSDGLPVARLADEIGHLDLVYEATGVSTLVAETIGILGTNGILVLTGVPGHDARVEIDTGALMRSLVLKNQVVLGTVNADGDAFAAAIRDLELFAGRWPDATRSLVTARYPAEAHRDLLLGRPHGIKNVLTF